MEHVCYCHFHFFQSIILLSVEIKEWILWHHVIMVTIIYNRNILSVMGFTSETCLSLTNLMVSHDLSTTVINKSHSINEIFIPLLNSNLGWTVVARRWFQIDNYAKNGGPGEIWLLFSFYHESLRTWIKKIVNKFAISNHTALLLRLRALRIYLKLICEYELYSLPNKKLVAQRDHGKN